MEQSLRETRIRHVSASPQPDCLLMNVENGIARYAVRYWLTDLAVDDPTDSAVRTLIDAALRRNDRRLTPPIFNVFMTTDQDHRISATSGIPPSAPIPCAACRCLPCCRRRSCCGWRIRSSSPPFVNGDRMLSQGEVSGWLFVLVKGDAQMLVEVEGRELALGTLNAGDFFGELSLLTGEPSPFTVRALGPSKPIASIRPCSRSWWPSVAPCSSRSTRC